MNTNLFVVLVFLTFGGITFTVASTIDNATPDEQTAVAATSVAYTIDLNVSEKVTTRDSLTIDWKQKPRDENEVWQRILMIAHCQLIKTPGTFERLIPEWNTSDLPYCIPVGWSIGMIRRRLIIESSTLKLGAELLTVIESKVREAEVLPTMDSEGNIVMIFGSERYPLDALYESEEAFLQAPLNEQCRAARAAQAWRVSDDEEGVAAATAAASCGDSHVSHPGESVPHRDDSLHKLVKALMADDDCLDPSL